MTTEAAELMLAMYEANYDINDDIDGGLLSLRNITGADKHLEFWLIDDDDESDIPRRAREKLLDYLIHFYKPY